MANVVFIKPINMFSLPVYKFQTGNQFFDGNDLGELWEMTDSTQLVVYYGSAGQVTTVGIGDETDLHLAMSNAWFTLSNADRSNLANGKIYSILKSALSGDDNITGSEGADKIEALTGSDYVTGMGGNDVLMGNDGYDVIAGNLGNDTIYGGRADDIVLVGQGHDKAYGDAGSDWVAILGASTVTVDLLRVGSQRIGAKASAELIGFENIIATDGSDRLFGSDGANSIVAGKGNDVISGRDGPDTLIGGTGRDTITGGSGADHFFFEPSDSLDFIKDFQDKSDKIVFTAGPRQFSDVKIQDDGSYAVIVYGRDWIRLENTDHRLLSDADFLFL